MNTNRTARIFSVMREKRLTQAPALWGQVSDPSTGWWRSECAFLGKGVARQRGALGVLGHFHANRGHVRCRQTRRPQQRILGEHFAVKLGDKIILAVGIVTPNLPELDGLHCHMRLRELVEKALSDYRDERGASIVVVVPRHYERRSASCSDKRRGAPFTVC